MGIKDTMRGGSGGTHATTGRQDFPHAPKLAPSGDMGTPELSSLVKAANPTPAGGAAPMGTSKVYQAPSSQRGYGKAAYAVPNESMPGIKDHYKDLRMGTNNSGNNPENQTMGRQDARSVSMTKSKGTMIQDAYGKPTTNNLGVSY
jgi:hypothetical protein